jgi:ligand-binding sensor domain-containing protein
MTLASWCQEAKRVAITKYTQNDGLSSYNITKIVRDVYGFMWVGTQEGLNRFDGKTFQSYSNSSPEKYRLGGSQVSDMAEDKKRNLLWVLTSYGDICGIDLRTRLIRKRITRAGHQKTLSDKWLRCLAVQGDTLWIGGHEVLSAYHITTDSLLAMPVAQQIGMQAGECNISRITFDAWGNMWVGSDGYGLAVLDPSFHLLASFRDQLRNGLPEKRKLRFWDMVHQNGIVYAATSWGLRRFQPGHSAITYLPNHTSLLPDTTEIQSITFASPDLLLFSTPSRFYSYNLFNQQLLAWYDVNGDNDWLTSTFSTFYDSTAQQIWVGTQAGLGSFSNSKAAFSVIHKSSVSDTRIRHAYALLPFAGNGIYAGDENGLFHVDLSTKEIIKIDEASTNLMLFKDATGHIFLSNKNGFFIVKGKQLTPAHLIFPCLKPLANDHLSCGLQFNDSLILFSSVIQKGLTVWNTRQGQLTVYHNDSARHPLEGLSIINFLYRNKKGTVFILTERSIIDFDPVTGKHATWQIPVPGITNIMDICETDSSYWMATYGNGVIETDKYFRIQKIISTGNGLSNNCIYRVFAHNNAAVIATTNNGLSIINCKNYFVKNYFQSDGIHSNAFEQVCGYQSDNKIYAGGVDGFTIIEPANFSTNPIPPRLYIDHITIHTRSGTIDTSDLAVTDMIIPNDVLQTTIRFSALNFSNPARVEYTYRIVELNSDWISLGKQNFINLIGLMPGNYTVLVRSCNEDGVCNATPLELHLAFLPKWYQTLLFKGLVLLLTAALVYAFVRYRINQIRKQQQIRKEIANDLHDDIGSTLNTVKIFTHLAKKEPQNQGHLHQIEDSLTQATIGLRDMIWVLDDNQDSLFELMERIKKFALPICQAHQIQFTGTIKADKNSRSISKTEKRNLLLISKEAINNSIKYAHCQNIWLELEQANHAITLTIRDDGKGFNLQEANEGNGLQNMQYRAKQISFAITIDSDINKGTVVKLVKKAN